MEQTKKTDVRLFSPETEHRGNDVRVARNFLLEMHLVHNINAGKSTTSFEEDEEEV